jgi:hypothetical protein
MAEPLSPRPIDQDNIFFRTAVATFLQQRIPIKGQSGDVSAYEALTTIRDELILKGDRAHDPEAVSKVIRARTSLNRTIEAGLRVTAWATGDLDMQNIFGKSDKNSRLLFSKLPSIMKEIKDVLTLMPIEAFPGNEAAETQHRQALMDSLDDLRKIFKATVTQSIMNKAELQKQSESQTI